MHLVRCSGRGNLSTLVRSELTRIPLTIVKHAQAPVRRVVEDLVGRLSFDVVHVEQQQALAGAEPARRAGIPVVLRAQNVESLLWTFAAGYRSSLVRWAFRREAGRLARWEGRCVRQVAATVALTAVDAGHLQTLAGQRSRVVVVEAPFDSDLRSNVEQLDGKPAVAVLASQKWLPNRDAVWRFVAETWPKVCQALPESHLHVFGIGESGDRAASVSWHRPPERSEAAFPEGAIFVIPARHPTGVPMKCLEAWARGLPVVGSPEAAEQLGAVDGEEMLVASGSEGFARAMVMLYEKPDLRARIVAGGRNALRTRHDPAGCVARLEKVYRQAMVPS